jgi:hypothetical protein
MGVIPASAIILSEHTNFINNRAMSGSDDDVKQESGGDNDLSKEADEKLLLFDMKGSKKPEYWSVIKLIAPNSTKKIWNSSECVGAYCTKCKLRLKYATSNPASIPRHINHKGLGVRG